MVAPVPLPRDRDCHEQGGEGAVEKISGEDQITMAYTLWLDDYTLKGQTDDREEAERFARRADELLADESFYRVEKKDDKGSRLCVWFDNGVRNQEWS